MKYNYILAVMAISAALMANVNAQTNVTQVPNLEPTNVPSISLAPAIVSTNDTPDYDKADLTFSTSGTSFGGHNDAGLDISFSADPFAALPNLWVGISQSLYWQPQFAASTDIDSDWVFNIYGNWYLNPGWSVGDIYGANTANEVRTGPELEVQYYFTDDIYLAGDVNYDLATETDGNWTFKGDTTGWRWSIGFGVEFGLIHKASSN